MLGVWEHQRKLWVGILASSLQQSFDEQPTDNNASYVVEEASGKVLGLSLLRFSRDVGVSRKLSP